MVCNNCLGSLNASPFGECLLWVNVDKGSLPVKIFTAFVIPYNMGNVAQWGGVHKYLKSFIGLLKVYSLWSILKVHTVLK